MVVCAPRPCRRPAPGRVVRPARAVAHAPRRVRAFLAELPDRTFGPAIESYLARRGSDPLDPGVAADLQTVLVSMYFERGDITRAERTAWAEPLAQVKRLHGWLLEVEHLLDGSLLAEGEVMSNVMVGTRLDRWRERMNTQLTDGSLSPLERECLTQFLQVFSNLRSHLVQCYDRQDFPRTNNDMERSMRGLKTQYRRVSGRKNWNAYLLRYGRCVAYAAWWEQDAAHRQHLEQQVGRLNPTRWRELRQQINHVQSEQLIRFRFRHKRQSLLASLETRWATVTQSVPLP